MKRFIAAVAAASLLAACSAADIRPIVDPATSVAHGANYERDVAECQQLAEQVNPQGKAIGGLIAGALVGAALGAAVGGANGNWGAGAGYGAAIGGATGGAAGTIEGAKTMEEVVYICMFRRGYSILDGGVMGLMSAPANPNGMTPAPVAGGQSKVPLVQ